jgi:hypothetical protein
VQIFLLIYVLGISDPDISIDSVRVRVRVRVGVCTSYDITPDSRIQS